MSQSRQGNCGVFYKVNLAVKEAIDEPGRKQTGNN